MSSPSFTPPKSILIIGSGVFGLSTTLALTENPLYKYTSITVVDRSPFPAPDGSSIDSSRIVRSDYSDPSYASLGAAALTKWRSDSRSSLGGQNRYNETGLLFSCDVPSQGAHYVEESLKNVQYLCEAANDTTSVTKLPTPSAMQETALTGGYTGDWGYVNRKSGWANAEESMIWLRSQVESTGRVKFVIAEVASLIYSSDYTTVLGAKCKDGSIYSADLTIVAAGAWSASLVDLRGRVTSSGQTLLYIALTEAEQKEYGKMPVVMNMSTGFFVITPRNRVLKVARHSHGYSNPTTIRNPNPKPKRGEEEITISLPITTWNHPSSAPPKTLEETIPKRAIRESLEFLHTLFPNLAPRPFVKGRVCWYSDTPKGDFLITYHPDYRGLLLATGGSGHAFKFLPVIGERIVEVIEGRVDETWKEKWGWRDVQIDGEGKVKEVVTEDGTRGGERGFVLTEELKSEWNRRADLYESICKCTCKTPAERRFLNEDPSYPMSYRANASFNT
ncbi:hypothetical protein B7494_g4486 [Chlorociboria aeruginascens]|nr:hypothetical protein B7494_g4486 [Chlorociboria aeruginascens]